MKKRNPYKTAQQEAMLQYFLEDRSDDGVPFSGAAGLGRICH